MRRLLFFAFLPLALAACGPFGGRENTQALLPADSLSRRVAASVEADTLRPAGRLDAPAEVPLGLPTGLAFTPDGGLVVVDTRSGSLHRFGPDGRHAGASVPDEPALAFPYLAGLRGDTVVVLSRGADRLDFVLGGRIARSVPVPEAMAALATDSALYIKFAEEDAAPYVARLDERGRVAARWPLAGPPWRHFGFLRMWGDRVVSLSGYRPVVDVLQTSTPTGTTLDTLALVGFDSPQLLRSHQFLRDEVDAPPLLTSSAVPVGRELFVLNVRTTGVRVDVYDRAGRLRRVLEAPYGVEEVQLDAFPADLAVRRERTGFLLAVLMQRPGGALSDPGGHVLLFRTASRAPAE